MKISDYLKEDNIILNLKSKTKEKAFEEIINITHFNEEKRKLIFMSLKQREVLGTTGIGKGIAIPHARSIVLDKLYLYVGLSKKGIEYSAMDGKSVHLIFLIMAPPLDEANQYLILLGKIAAISKLISKSKKYLKIETKEDFINLIKEYESKIEEEI